MQEATNQAVEAKRVIESQIRKEGNLDEAQQAFQRLTGLSPDLFKDHRLQKLVIFSSTQYATLGRLHGELPIVRQAHGFLQDLATLHCDGPKPRQALAEATVDLMVAEARYGQMEDALLAYSDVEKLAANFPDEANLAISHAKGAANLVAFSAERNSDAHVTRAFNDLKLLSRTHSDTVAVQKHFARGLFNIVSNLAKLPSPKSALDYVEELVKFALASETDDPEILQLAAEALFSASTQLGSLDAFPEAYECYYTLTMIARIEDQNVHVTRQLADCAFNLITDFCRVGDCGLAMEIYGDLSGLSVIYPDDSDIRYTQAKSASNLALTLANIGQDDAASLIEEELVALILTADDPTLFEEFMETSKA